MYFIDEAINEIKAGNGGNGVVSFRKEKYVPLGGPDGGNGGKGGSIFFIGEQSENNLLKLKYQKHLKAKNGENGKNKNKHGANAENIYIKVPLGTIIYNLQNEITGEILKHGEILTIAKGGRGGKGNKSLATFKNPVPKYAEKGGIGESFKIKTELKILADVGLIGYPSVGKSTLISIISDAKPKIADYPFTTLKPYLGMVYVDNESFIVADLPGLIPNAHLGKGMGIKFLKHIERCRILIHMCDMSKSNPLQDIENLNQELKIYNKNLLKKPQIIIANKMDIIGAKTKLIELQKKILNKNIIPTSLLKNQNLKILKYKMLEMIKKNVVNLPLCENSSFKTYTLEEEKPDFVIKKDNQGFFVVKGEKIEKFFYKTDFNNEEATKKFAIFLKKIGVEEELIKKGVYFSKNKIKICDRVFEFIT
ncbi:GTPase ObgE [Candidatus Phytoplasma mali]|uniref:GTPase Obg n=1 Tax=Phytoplasma mali (strain AT) TaxID=482235 RepID=OBG_PHYMT|nr:GTPase ObgE [Candidatus Phytoplasma mali]B3QZT1.1 RecName: Full=GTPase Obg; AltName: Full=GTP-binding protein Obg [Candidatus Phytoplasma mali AT]CAP18468.1 GTPase ObgE [Candidatus Phytoplasma mali]